MTDGRTADASIRHRIVFAGVRRAVASQPVARIGRLRARVGRGSSPAIIRLRIGLDPDVMNDVMGRENVDVENLTITGATPSEGADAPLTIRDEVIIIVNQAYGPRGDQLVGLSDVTFDGFAALTLRVHADGHSGLVHLSPIHGDGRKRGMEALKAGTRCQLLCPVSNEPLPMVGEVGDDSRYCAIYLTPKLSRGSMIYMSDVWGHHHSRIIDDNEMISLWVASEMKSA